MAKEEKNEEILEDIKGAVKDLGDIELPSEREDKAEEELDLAKELEAAQEEVAEYQDKMMRLAAEFENFKKRMERDRNKALKYAGEPVLKEILPAIDNLGRAIEQGSIKGVAPEKSLAALLEGVQLTLNGLLTTLEKLEVTPIESVGKPFDPTIQEALTMESSADISENHVVNEFEKGYYYKDRLLRVAKVIVSSGNDSE